MPFRLTQHSPIDRRAFLAGAGGAVALGAVGLGAPPAFTPTTEEPVDLRDRWTEILTARAHLNIVGPRVREHLHRNDSEVSSFLHAARNAPDGSVFPEYPFESDESGALSSTATRLATMARAWATPASSWSNSEQLRDALVAGVERLVQSGYHAGARPVGNWWNWEIGTPRPLADLMCIMRNELPPQTFEDAGEAIRHFIPDPQYSELMNYPTTGSGRVNACRGALIAAVAEQDTIRIAECVEALPEAWRIVDTAGGFYADGGFIHHLDVAYTGSYGVELIENLAPILSLIDGSEFDVIDRAPLWDRIDDAFLPVMVNGHMMDFVRGRAVARPRANGSVIGRATLAAIVELAASAPTTRRESWYALFDQWAQKNPSLDLFAGPDVTGAVVLAEIEGVTSPTNAEPQAHYFPSMDRLVHRASGWTLAIAMCSNRVAAYEATEQENAWASRTGNAMRYLYVNGDPGPFDDHFWATLNYAKPPGTTNHAVAHVEAPTRSSDSKTPSNEWTGGLVHGNISIAAMHQEGLGGDAPNCRRLIIATTDRIIELVSGLSTRRRSFTAIESRMLPEGDTPNLVVDGKQIRDEVTVENPTWAHLDGVAGYLFLSKGPVTAGTSLRIGSKSRIERSIAEIDEDDRVARQWANIELSHHDNTSGAWALLPGATLSATRDAAAPAPPRSVDTIVRNDGDGQIVDLGDTIIVAAWRPLVASLPGSEVRFPDPLLALLRPMEDRLQLTITEPTQARDTSIIQVAGSWSVHDTSGIATSSVEVSASDGLTKLTIDTSKRGGRPFTVSLQPS